ncbi:protein RALF-like 24 [Rhodamnia argentea]|uniref:Protein RALF-like 24 n=1 Tax=Rhodamnia argentea TaxID=178133 RepID=A0A8B8QKV8_9MYRT|nr:protein RALF-like 24 [Rhodamnia argentea]
MLRINSILSPRATTLSLALLLLFLLHTHLAICSAMPVLGAHAMKSGEIDAALKRACSRSIGDCLSEAETVDLEAEASRRVLLAPQKKYISYETLRRDMVPCTTAGASYYNCHSGTANPYNRGCAVITWCARNIRDIKT